MLLSAKGFLFNSVSFWQLCGLSCKLLWQCFPMCCYSYGLLTLVLLWCCFSDGSNHCYGGNCLLLDKVLDDVM